MKKVPYFLAMSVTGDWTVGRTDHPVQTKQPIRLPNGEEGWAIVAPAQFVESFRANWIEENPKLRFHIIKNEFSNKLTRLALLEWNRLNER